MQFVKGYCRYCFRKSEKAYCSADCRRLIAKKKELLNSDPDSHRCLICGIKIPLNQKMCSNLCVSINLRRLLAHKQEQKKAGYQPVNCIICDQEFIASKPDVVTCGKECLKKSKQAEKTKRIAEYIRLKKKFDDSCEVTAVCPMCGITHVKKLDVPFIGTGTPRLRCEKWPYCAMNSIYQTDPGHIVDINDMIGDRRAAV